MCWLYKWLYWHNDATRYSRFCLLNIQVDRVYEAARLYQVLRQFVTSRSRQEPTLFLIFSANCTSHIVSEEAVYGSLFETCFGGPVPMFTVNEAVRYISPPYACCSCTRRLVYNGCLEMFGFLPGFKPKVKLHDAVRWLSGVRNSIETVQSKCCLGHVARVLASSCTAFPMTWYNVGDFGTLMQY